MSENREFIRFCGQLVFGDGISAWDQLTKDSQIQFCRMAQKNGWDMLFVRCLNDRLPEPFYQTFRTRYQTESLKRLVESGDLADLYRLLESAKIPFVPIKGADFAFRIYPDQALRPPQDWDILFREEDCPGTIRLLQEHGWQTFSGYDPLKPEHHHYEGMHNDRNSIEVHWTLPHFENAGEQEIWQGTEAISEYHWVLTQEMNVMLPLTKGEHYTFHLQAQQISSSIWPISEHLLKYNGCQTSVSDEVQSETKHTISPLPGKIKAAMNFFPENVSRRHCPRL